MPPLGWGHVEVLNTLTESKVFSKPLTLALVFLGVLKMLNRAPKSQIMFSRSVPWPVITLSMGGKEGTAEKVAKFLLRCGGQSEAFPTENASISTALGEEVQVPVWSMAQQEKTTQRVPSVV